MTERKVECQGSSANAMLCTVPLRHASLFSGIGGFDLAATWMGWKNIFHCEINDFCNKILNYYWPNAKEYKDIRKTDFTVWKNKIDVLTGGFPCQPYSLAGKRKGKEDERHLWPEMLRAIREIQPRWVVGENVRGIINWNGGLVFEEVQANLEDSGYEVQSFILPACGVNAPHKRDRVWFVAHSDSFNGSLSIQQWGQKKAKNINARGENESRSSSDPENVRLQQSRHIRKWRTRFKNDNCNDSWIDVNTNGTGQQKRNASQEPSKQTFSSRRNTSDWSNWPTQPPICCRDDGVSTGLDGITFPRWRNESLKGFGNSIVPNISFNIFKAIEECVQHGA